MTRREMYHHLTKSERDMESLFSAFAAVFSVWILTSLPYDNALSWAGIPSSGATVVSAVMMAAVVIHLIGIKVNGRWHLSPALRVVGLTVMALVFAAVGIRSGVESTQFPMHIAAAGLYFVKATGALKDLLFCIGDRHA